MGNPETPSSTTHSPDNPGSWGKAGDLSRKDPEKMNGRAGGGDSAGGAYPNPHTGKGGSDHEGYMGHGGQTHMDYEGGPNSNAPAEKTKPGKDED